MPTTPGDWKADHDPDFSPPWAIVAEQGDDEVELASVYGDGEEAESNAKLLGAAKRLATAAAVARDTRLAQKEYFRTRASEHLIHSKNLESKLDKLLKELTDVIAEVEP